MNIKNINNLKFYSKENVFPIDLQTAQTLESILNTNEINSIVEFGTGASTRIFSYYKSHDNNNCEIISFDNDLEYQKTFEIDNVQLVHVDAEINENESYYINISKYIHNLIDLVFIDGPYGYMSKLPRTNILNLIKENKISDNAYIIIHDSNRQGEINLMIQITSLLLSYHKNFEIIHYNKHSIIKLK